MMKTEIDLYTSGTPNGQKINIALEELSLNYTVHNVEISKNVQKEEWFLKINPNGRIPAIVDKTSGTPKRVFEGGAILLYLCAKYDPDNKMSFPYDSPEYWEVVEWLVWMQSGLGAMQGQANHFYRYAPKKIEYAIDRYQTETKRLYSVLEARLEEQENTGKGLWIVGDATNFTKISKWMDVINERPATKTGLDIPEPFEMKKAMKTKEGEEAYAKHHSNWVMQGQKSDQEKHK